MFDQTTNEDFSYYKLTFIRLPFGYAYLISCIYIKKIEICINEYPSNRNSKKAYKNFIYSFALYMN